jgi:hypothetical protein
MMNGNPKYKLIEINVRVAFGNVMNSWKYCVGDNLNTAMKRQWGLVDSSELIKNVPPLEMACL